MYIDSNKHFRHGAGDYILAKPNDSDDIEDAKRYIIRLRPDLKAEDIIAEPDFQNKVILFRYP